MPALCSRSCLVTLLCSVLAAGCTSPDPVTTWVAELIVAERDLADSLATAGMRQGMASFMAPASTALGPAPVDGRSWANSQPDERRKTVIRHAHISAAGDLGFALGLWPRADSASGHYVNVWQRGDSGRWLIACTAWLSHAPARTPERVDTTEAPGLVRANRKLYQEASRVSMLGADKELGRRSLDRSAAWAFSGAAADSIYLLRENQPPVRGRDGALEALRQTRGVLSWVPLGSRVAQSGDLGFTYGFQTAKSDAIVQSRAYLRIWKAMPDSSWSILVHAVTRPVLD